MNIEIKELNLKLLQAVSLVRCNGFQHILTAMYEKRPPHRTAIFTGS